MITGIVCVDNKWGIGKKNDLLFNIPADMKFFRETTKNSIVVMGYNCLLSLPKSKPLPNRVNIVMCPEGIEIDGAICIHDFNQLVKYVTILSKNYQVFIIGGGMIYKSFLDYYDNVYVTKVDADGEAEVFFPNLDISSAFDCTHESDKIYDNGYNIKFTTYTRRK